MNMVIWEKVTSPLRWEITTDNPGHPLLDSMHNSMEQFIPTEEEVLR